MIAAGAALLCANAVQAQKYPDRAVRLIVPFPPGGQTDNVSRQLSVKITPILGQIPIVCTTLSGALPHHRSGRVRTLAVMKEERSVSAPEIPTTAEGGVPGAIAYTYNILLAPGGTPRSVVDQLSGAMTTVMADRSFVDALVKLGVDPITDSDPDKAAAMLKTEFEKWAPLIRSLGLGH